jgi:hypothetical protein
MAAELLLMPSVNPAFNGGKLERCRWGRGAPSTEGKIIRALLQLVRVGASGYFRTWRWAMALPMPTEMHGAGGSNPRLRPSFGPRAGGRPAAAAERSGAELIAESDRPQAAAKLPPSQRLLDSYPVVATG